MSTDETDDDGPDDGPDDAPAEGGEGAAAGGAESAAGEGGRRRRRRRRRRDRGPEGASAGPPPTDGGAPASSPPPPRRDDGRERRDDGRERRDDGRERRDDGRERRQWGNRPGPTGGGAPGAGSPGAGSPGAGSPDADAAAPAAAVDGSTSADATGSATAPTTAPTTDTVVTRDERGRRERSRRGRGERGANQRGEGQRGDGPRGDGPRGDGPRGDGPRGDGPRGDGARGDGPRGERGRGERRDDRGPRREEPRGDRSADATSATAATPTYEAPTARLQQQARRPVADEPDDVPEAPAEKWGVDDDAPAKDVTLAADLPAQAPADDLDPATHHLLAGAPEKLGEDVVGVVGVRFVVGGRIQWCDAGDTDYGKGERVIVDSDRGPRLATIAAPPQRRSTRDRGLRRVIRRANEADLAGEREGDTEKARLLRIAKDAAAQLRLPLKVYRIEGGGGKLNVYYTSDERLDLRDLVRNLGNATQSRIELRQLGVRDEAKAVGGIGSCGLTLCCTTWLPDFVPVSIKMAKDQGLVLSPTKVSGQCGRLKCCLVYEQAGYAELRKGLPKLGKRVISPRGEGRVVEVDVLRQRVRVSYGMGDNEVLPASEVKPLFPSGNQPPQERGPRPPRGGEPRDADHDDETEAEESSDKLPIDDALLGSAVDDDDLGPTDDPSSDHYKPE